MSIALLLSGFAGQKAEGTITEVSYMFPQGNRI
jgi:hypothetical protein